ncbi:response regulator [Ktedonobacter racemifer]|uniref:Two component transcriptional regulator, LuxR family n=1 Tax=Ktedonobacter racemifer DSM 44963 TaxID=485913 RepID=D6THM7_KTERA|nr:response regulator transcription factor [Ktedonobacter racemifer]EFH89032.1 two component transcriptional regulator, LuxR family [Ktedonobacter racemifer DSM 44963]
MEGKSSTDPIRLVIADDHAFYREGVRTMLLRLPDMEVIGEAADGDETIAKAESLQPDVILMDIKMPGTNGIEATRRILHTSPHIQVLVVTMFEDDDSVFAAMRAGARGYLLKDADRDELVRAIKAVSQGEAIFSPAIAQRMIRYFSALPRTASAIAFPDLTERERQILHLIAQGESNTAIAKRFTLSLKTVQNHVSNIFSKLQVADRAQAIVRARDAGLGT